MVLKITYEAEGIVNKVYGDEGETKDVEIQGLEVLETLLPYMQTSFNTNPKRVKITIEVMK